MLTLLLATVQTSVGLGFSVLPGTGMALNLSGVPVVKGSWWQYYEPGWIKGYYSSPSSPQTLDKLPNGDTRLTWKSEDGLAYGEQLYHPTTNGVDIDYVFNWKGPKTAMVELTGGILWAPAFQNGKLFLNDQETRSLLPRKYSSASNLVVRSYGKSGSRCRFDGPLGETTVTTSVGEWTVFDARGYSEDWARKDDLMWLGMPGLRVEPNEPKKVHVEWRVRSALAGLTEPTNTIADFGTATAAKRAVVPAPPLPVVPKPKESKLTSKYALLGGHPVFDLPASMRDDAGRIQQLLSALWQATPGGSKVVGRVADLKLPAEGYVLRMTGKAISITGQDEAGLRHGLYRLALLAQPNDGKLVVPVGEIRDWPSIPWRGIHMFGGPAARPFHTKLFSRVLAPLGYNNAVLQVERTDWKATPTIKTDLTMPREELVKEFEMLRALHVEPTPLIQSFGHMEWLFANNQNLDLTLNPKQPYTLNLDNPKANKLIEAIWDEANALLKPKVFHFGLDEVGLVGDENDAARITRFWKSQVPFLDSLAKRHGAKTMIWSDVALAPGEAPDATSAETVAEAEIRRAAIPKGTWIGDWHYQAADSVNYDTSLKIWKKDGQVPIASTWYIPDNVRNFALSAIRNGCGLLQTTWCGYASNEPQTLGAPDQYSAYLLAADYAWSGRTEAPTELGYDPQALFRRLYLMSPQATNNQPGWWVSRGREANLGGLRFSIGVPFGLRSAMTHSPRDFDQIVVSLDREITGIGLAMDCQAKSDINDPVAELTITPTSGKPTRVTLRYGNEIRALGDPYGLTNGERAGTYSVFKLELPARQKIRSISLRPLNRYSGTRLYGVTGW